MPSGNCLLLRHHVVKEAGVSERTFLDRPRCHGVEHMLVASIPSLRASQGLGSEHSQEAGTLWSHGLVHVRIGQCHYLSSRTCTRH